MDAGVTFSRKIAEPEWPGRADLKRGTASWVVASNGDGGGGGGGLGGAPGLED
jgi:hypothetical protein